MNILKDTFSLSPSVWNIKIAIINILVSCLLSVEIGVVSSFYPAGKTDTHCSEPPRIAPYISKGQLID